MTTIQQQITTGESRTLEFKKELPTDSSKWIKTIVAFANGAGGKLVIGVNNQRKIIGLPYKPEFLEIGDMLRVNLYRPTYKTDSTMLEECRESAEKLPCKCPVSAEKVYTAILENPKSSNKDLCVILKLSDRAVRNQIKILKDAGFIERVGSDKVGYWQVIKEGADQ